MRSDINYTALNLDVIQTLSTISFSRVLDIGCGTGELGFYLKSKDASLTVDGITYSDAEAALASIKLNSVWVQDLNHFDSAKFDKEYDLVICSHVLEHLYEPWKLINDLESLISPNGHILIALPNLFFYKQRVELLMGNFNYSKSGGLMDITHFRFFTWHSSEVLYHKTPSLYLVRKIAFGSFPQPLIRKLFPSLANRIDKFFTKIYPGLFGFQFVILLKKF